MTDNQIAIDTALPLDAAPLVKPGMAVDIDEQSLGIKAKGVVESVDQTPGTHGVDGYHIYCGIRVDESPAPLQGFSLRLTIPVKSTKQAVITVPLSAVSLAADGKSRVQVRRRRRAQYRSSLSRVWPPTDSLRSLPIDGALEPGQLVVVGYENGEGKATQL